MSDPSHMEARGIIFVKLVRLDPSCNVQTATSNAKPAAAYQAQAHATALGGVARKISSRARRAALVLVGAVTIDGRCNGERPASFGERPWCDVPAANTQPAAAREASAGMRHCARCVAFEA